MTNIQSAEVILTRMAELLRLGALNDWVSALDNFSNEIAIDPTGTATKIIASYGGIGSLNDRILSKNGQPLAMENNELDTLRSQLYELCHKIS